MSSTFKNRVLLIAVILLFIPFMLITDIFPFMRFGMFAEPVRKEVQTEIFLLFDQENKEIVDPKSLGFHGSSFQYLARNYFYRNETNKFMSKLAKMDVKGEYIYLLKVSFPPGNPEKADTSNIRFSLKTEF